MSSRRNLHPDGSVVPKIAHTGNREHSAKIRTHLEKLGTPISPNDLIIAATVRAANAILVTANQREFPRIPGLVCVDWTA